MNRTIYLGLLTLAPVLCAAVSPRAIYRIETIAGSSGFGDGGPAKAAQISNIQGVVVDRSGNIYISDTDHHRVRKIAATGIITTIAGTGTAGYGGDGGPAAAARLKLPYGLAVDSIGNLYVADLGNDCVRRISIDGNITTYAGNGQAGSGGDGGLATSAQLLVPRNLAIDSAGTLYISEFGGHRVRRVTADGKISTVAGMGVAGFRGDGSAATAAQLCFPAGLALDRFGALYIADSQNQRIRKVLPGGQIATVLGGSNDTALLTPTAVSVDLAGNLYVVDSLPQIHKYSSTGVWLNVAGTGASGFGGDGGPATSALLTAPLDLAGDLNGNLYFADRNRLRQLDPNGIIHTIAGDNYRKAVGDGGPAIDAQLLRPTGLALDGAGNLYIADTGTQRVRRVGLDGKIATVAGNGLNSRAADGSVATLSPLMDPKGLAVDAFGNFLLAEAGAQRVRQVAADGRIWTLAGTGAAGLGPEFLLPVETPLRNPQGLCRGPGGILYVADSGNHRILLLPPGGLVSTAAGNGAPGDGGDDGLARLAQLSQPSACAVDTAGNLYVADTYNHRIRKVDTLGHITTVAGTGIAGDSGDEGPAVQAALNTPGGVAADDNGNIYIADTMNHRIRQVTPDGVIHTVAGKGAVGFEGADGPALDALLDSPVGMLLDGSGDIYFADSNNNRVRRLVPVGLVTPPPVAAPPEPLSVVNAASLAPGPIAPGEAVTIFGKALGPVAPVGAALDSAGLLANQLGDTEVRFDGIPAPLFYVQANQINVQVPYAVAGKELSHIEVFYGAKSAGTAAVAIVDAAPAIFAAVLNQDGTINSESHPAPRGTYITLFATGSGLSKGADVTGLPAADPYPAPKLSLSVTVNGIDAAILWAGSAPNLVGLLQVNLRVPGGYVPSGPVPMTLKVGIAISPELPLWVK